VTGAFRAQRRAIVPNLHRSVASNRLRSPVRVPMTKPGERRRRASSPSRAVAGRLIAAQEEERRRIARELHDDVSQRLALLAVQLEQVALDSPGDDAFRRRWRDLARTAGDIATDLHRISHRLHPAKLETLGLVAAIGGFCQELWCRQRLRVRFTHANVPHAIPGDVALCLYRIVQEGLQNVIKHSGVLEADVHLAGDGHELLLRIADAGGGFIPNAPSAGGVGLASMQERVNAIGGTLIVHAAPGLGTRIVVKVDAEPLNREHSAE
jgi:signal transduction histidine kinase